LITAYTHCTKMVKKCNESKESDFTVVQCSLSNIKTEGMDDEKNYFFFWGDDRALFYVQCAVPQKSAGNHNSYERVR